MHKLAEWEESLVKRPAADSFEGHGAVGTHDSDVYHAGGVLGQPRHDGMVEGNFTLDALFEVELVGAENPGNLFHLGFDLAVGCRVVRVGVLFHQLLELFDLQPRFRQRVSKQLQDRRLIVRAQGQPPVAQPGYVLYQRIDGVVRWVDVFL